MAMKLYCNRHSSAAYDVRFALNLTGQSLAILERFEETSPEAAPEHLPDGAKNVS